MVLICPTILLAVIVLFAVTLLATRDNGKITVDDELGKVTVTLSALDTTLKAEPYVYDLVLDSGTIITRALEGQFIVTAGVTV